MESIQNLCRGIDEFLGCGFGQPKVLDNVTSEGVVHESASRETVASPPVERRDEVLERVFANPDT